MLIMVTKILIPKLQLALKSDAHLGEYTAQRLNDLKVNAAAFPNLSPTTIDLTDAYNDFVNATEICGRSGNPANTTAKNNAREKLCNILSWVAQSCIEIADGDKAVFELSGFELKSKAQRISSIDCPVDIKTVQGPFSGSVYCSFTAVTHAKCYEVQYGATPNDFDNWSTMITSTSRKAIVTDLTPRTIGYLRIRTVGPRNIISDWSVVIQFTVM